jgi:hypothetical protein
MEVDDSTPVVPSFDNIPTNNDPNHNATDDDGISDDATVTTRGSSGPRPAPVAKKPIVRDITFKFLLQSSQDLSNKEAVSNCSSRSSR